MRAIVRRRVTWIVTISSLLPLLIVWGIALLISYRTQANSAQRQQAAMTSQIADDFSRFVLISQNQLSIFGNTLIKGRDPGSITDEQLRALVLSSTSFAEVGFYTSNGQRQAGAAHLGTPTLPDSIINTPLFDAVKSGQIFFGDPAPLKASTLPLRPIDVPRLRIAVPVQVSFEDRLILVGEIRMEQLWTITTRIERSSGTQVRILVLTTDGLLISASKLESMIAQPALRDIPLFQANTLVASYRSPLGEEVLGNRSTITPPGWIVIVEQPLSEIYADVENLALNLLIVILLALPVVVGVGWLSGRRIARPIQQLYQGVERFTHDPRSYQPVNIQTHDELETLGQAFNTMIAVLNESQARLAQANEELENLVTVRTSELQLTLQELQERNRGQETLLETVRRLSMPVIPITRGMMVMPLVGEFTDTRAHEIGPHLLGAIEREKARIVLIDITGVPLVDESVARTLIDTAAAARLLGVEVVLAGIRPDIAETLINLGIDLRSIRSTATLEQAFTLGMGDLNKAGRRS